MKQKDKRVGAIIVGVLCYLNLIIKIKINLWMMLMKLPSSSHFAKASQYI
jgi:hypothetical protein